MSEPFPNKPLSGEPLPEEPIPRQSAPRSRPAGLRTMIVISLAMHIPLFIYPVLRLCDWLGVNTTITLLVLLPVATSQVISRWLLRDAKARFARGSRYVADLILGISPIVLLILLPFELIVAAEMLAPAIAAQLLLILVVAITCLGVAFAMIPSVKTVSFDARGLDKPLRFVQITDVHIGSRSSRFLEHVLDRVNRLEPEFLCITGDFIDASGVTESELESLRDVCCPVYFTTGNHERYEDLADILIRLESLGVQVLRTQDVRPRTDVQVLGIDDRDQRNQVEQELSKLEVDRKVFSILMYHRPDGLEAAEAAGVRLMISGHTHNGQIFPFNLIVNRVFERIVGLYEFGSARLYVSSGTGTWGPVLRIGTRSEITLFEVGTALSE